MTEEQLKQLALLAIQNEERINELFQLVNNLIKRQIAEGKFSEEQAAILISGMKTEDAFYAVAQTKRAEKRAFFGLPFSPKSSN